MSERRAYLICYDIAGPKRLAKVHRFLRERALAVQYSVFAGVFTPVGIDRVVRGLRALIDERYDDVRVYPVPHRTRVFLAGGEQLRGVLLLAGEQLAPFLREQLGPRHSEEPDNEGL